MGGSADLAVGAETDFLVFPAEALADRGSGPEQVSPRDAAPDPFVARLRAVLERLDAGVRVVVVGSPRPLRWPEAVATVLPGELCLEAGELEAEARVLGVGERAVREVRHITGGWPAPSLRCFERLEAGSNPGTAELEDEARTAAWSAIRQRLAPMEVGLLESLCRSPSKPLSTWRQALTDDPPRLAALEGLARRWGLLAQGSAGEVGPAPSLLALPGEAGRNPATSPPAGRGTILLAAPSLETAARGLVGLDRSATGESPAPTAGSDRSGSEIPSGAPDEQPTPRPPVSEPPAFARATAGPPAVTPAGLGDVRRADASWSLHLLGPPRVVRHDASGDEEIDWQLRRAFLLVAYLAVAPERRATREELAEAAWRESRPDAIGRNFHPTLSEARRGLLGNRSRRGGGIVYRQGHYLLDPSLEWHCDRDRFLEHLARAEQARPETVVARDRDPGGTEEALGHLRAAWKLYRGPLLEGFEGEWIERERERLYRRYLEMLSEFGGLAAELGRDFLALDAYRSVLLSEPFEEGAHLAVIEIYGRRGRRDLVRRQFVRLQEALKELGVEPSERAVERYHRLMG